MLRHLSSDARKCINETPTIKRNHQGMGLGQSAERVGLLSLTVVRLCEMT